jgi:hypothetical protein
MAAADALVVIGADEATVPAGTLVPAMPLDGDLKGADRFPG